MVGFRQARETVEAAAEAVRDNSQLLMIVAGAAIVIATIALVVAVTRG